MRLISDHIAEIGELAPPVLAAVAALVTGWRRPFGTRARAAILVAVIVMFAMYLVPHSLRGSTLDYQQLEEGVSAEDAIRTG